MPEREHLGRCRVVAASQHDDQAEYLADQQLDDLEQHRPANHQGVQPADNSAGQTAIEYYSSGTGSLNGSRAGSRPPSMSSAA
jgi:hypothetical protein